MPLILAGNLYPIDISVADYVALAAWSRRQRLDVVESPGEPHSASNPAAIAGW